MRTFVRWDEVSTTIETDELLLQLAHLHCERVLDKDLRAALSKLIVEKDIRGLCSYEPDYHTLSTGDALNVRQITAFFSKRSDIDLGVNRREAAVRKFIESEDLCRTTNLAFIARREGKFSFPLGVESLLFRAQRKIASILGEAPKFSDLSVRFGPGATTQVKRKNASARRKLSSGFACSEDMAPVVGLALEEVPAWVFDPDENDPDNPLYTESKKVSVHLHDGKLVFVPKNAKTDRPVVVEPSLNTMFQSGVGVYIADRLRSVGVDIRDQTRNQRAAREGSITGELATLDLSSASDTISRELVYDLLPVDWYFLLASLRTSHVEYCGVRLHLEKFSSMGNGFTFPLETLIFYALACACVEDHDISRVCVYGDDIIIPTYAYTEMCFLLAVTGFVPNAAKSFSEGPFRESCGGDYLRGIDIRPCYIKGPLACFDVFRLHNFYVRQNDEEMAATIVKFVGPQIRIFGPDGYGDGHLLGGQSSLRPHGRSLGWCGYTFETFTFRPRKELATLPGDRVYPVYSTYVSSQDDLGTSLGSLRASAFEFASREGPSLQHRYTKGLLVTTVPGVRSYNRIKIYVLA